MVNGVVISEKALILCIKDRLAVRSNFGTRDSRAPTASSLDDYYREDDISFPLVVERWALGSHHQGKPCTPPKDSTMYTTQTPTKQKEKLVGKPEPLLLLCIKDSLY